MSIEFDCTIFDPTFGWMSIFVDDRDVMPPRLADQVLNWLETAQLFSKTQFIDPRSTSVPLKLVTVGVAARPYGVVVWGPPISHGRRTMLSYRYYLAAQCSNGYEVLGRLLIEKPNKDLALAAIQDLYEDQQADRTSQS